MLWVLVVLQPEQEGDFGKKSTLFSPLLEIRLWLKLVVLSGACLQMAGIKKDIEVHAGELPTAGWQGGVLVSPRGSLVVSADPQSPVVVLRPLAVCLAAGTC